MGNINCSLKTTKIDLDPYFNIKIGQIGLYYVNVVYPQEKNSNEKIQNISFSKSKSSQSFYSSNQSFYSIIDSSILDDNTELEKFESFIEPKLKIEKKAILQIGIRESILTESDKLLNTDNEL